MKVTEYDGRKYFSGWAGLDLYFHEHRPEGEAKAAVIVLHGYSEHSERYAHVVEQLNKAGFSAYLYDQRGHGRSEGVRGDVLRMRDYSRDLETFAGYVRSVEPGKKVFLLAHSTGAVTSIALAAERPEFIDGVVATGVYIRDAGEYEPWKIIAGRVLSVFVPLLPIQELKPSRVAQDPAVQKAFASDPLIYHGGVRVRMGMHFVDMEKYIQEYIEMLHVPVFCVHGAADKLASSEGSRYVYDTAPSKDKKLDILEGVGHEVLNDFGWKDQCGAIIQWLKDRAT